MIAVQIPFLRRTRLQPGELLPSLFARLARLNYYVPTSILDLVYLDSLDFRDSLPLPRHQDTYVRLEMLSGIDAHILYTASEHRFAELLTRRWGNHLEIDHVQLPTREQVPLLSGSIAQEQLRPHDWAQYCPACLAGQTPYHRLSWSPYASAACLEHRCLLRSTCHTCLEFGIN